MDEVGSRNEVDDASAWTMQQQIVLTNVFDCVARVGFKGISIVLVCSLQVKLCPAE